MENSAQIPNEPFLRVFAIMTEILRSILTGVALFGVPAEAGSTDRVDTLLQQVARLEPEDQQRFLFWIESRLNRANAIILPPKEAGAARAALHARIRRETVTWPELWRLLRELDRSENQAIEKLAHKYGLLQTIRVFRSARQAEEQWQRAWSDVYATWAATGRPLAQQDKLLDWLTTAIELSSTGTAAELPRAPHFTADSLVSRLPSVPTQAASREPAASEPAIPRAAPAAPATRPTPPTQVAEPFPQPILPASPQAGAPRALTQAEAIEPAAPTVRKRVAAFAAGGGGRTPTLSELETAIASGASGAIAPHRSVWKAEEPRPAGSLAASPARETSPLRTALIFVPVSAPETAIARPIPTTAEPTVRMELPERPVKDGPMLPGRPALPSATLSPAEGAPDTSHPARPEPPVQPEISLAGVGRHTSRTLSEPRVAGSGLDEALHGSGIDEGLPGFPRHRAFFAQSNPFHAEMGQSAPPATRPGLDDAEPAVGVNVDELRTRIAGTNMALRALEAELYGAGSWNHDELASIVARLHALVLRAEDMRLFREMVPEETRSLIDVADSPQPAITLAAARIADARQRISDGRDTGTERERQAELGRLNELSRRLAEIAEVLSQ